MTVRRTYNREFQRRRRKTMRQEEPAKLSQEQWRYKLKFLYGITFEDYVQLFVNQGGRCAICLTPDPGRRRFHVDHCHKTNVVRGLLCSNCNTGLGKFKEDTTLLDRAVAYLS